MSAVLPILLSLIGQIAGSLGTPASIMTVITTLEQWLPTIIKEVQDVAPLIQNIVTALRGNSAITQEQIDALDALEERIDAEFEAAASLPTPDEMAP